MGGVYKGLEMLTGQSVLECYKLSLMRDSSWDSEDQNFGLKCYKGKAHEGSVENKISIGTGLQPTRVLLWKKTFYILLLSKYFVGDRLSLSVKLSLLTVYCF